MQDKARHQPPQAASNPVKLVFAGLLAGAGLLAAGVYIGKGNDYPPALAPPTAATPPELAATAPRIAAPSASRVRAARSPATQLLDEVPPSLSLGDLLASQKIPANFSHRLLTRPVKVSTDWARGRGSVVSYQCHVLAADTAVLPSSATLDRERSKLARLERTLGDATAAMDEARANLQRRRDLFQRTCSDCSSTAAAKVLEPYRRRVAAAERKRAPLSAAHNEQTSRLAKMEAPYDARVALPNGESTRASVLRHDRREGLMLLQLGTTVCKRWMQRET